MKKFISLNGVAAFLCLAGTLNVEIADAGQRVFLPPESGVDLPGGDLRIIDLPGTPVSEQACLNECKNEPECVAWTYVRPGVQGETARCYLKQIVPDPMCRDCCISGRVKLPKTIYVPPDCPAIQPALNPALNVASKETLKEAAKGSENTSESSESPTQSQFPGLLGSPSGNNAGTPTDDVMEPDAGPGSSPPEIYGDLGEAGDLPPDTWEIPPDAGASPPATHGEPGQPEDLPPGIDGQQTEMTQDFTIEESTRRNGGDYRRFVLDYYDVEDCQTVCREEQQCRAFTLVGPTPERNFSVCYLKDELTPPVRDRCCTSGIKVNRGEWYR